MNAFQFHLPTRILFGSDTIAQTGEAVKAAGGSRVLVLYGTGSVQRNGVLDKVLTSLGKQGLSYSVEGGIQPNPRLAKAQELADAYAGKGIDFLLGVGGASVLDTCKAVAIGLACGGSIWDYFCKVRPITGALPVGSVLTIAAAGSETSDSAVLTDEATDSKRGCNTPFNRPAFAILDPTLTYTLPAYQTACGAADMMLHTMERYFGVNAGANEITDGIAEALLRTVISNAPKALKQPDNYQARSELMWCGSLSHNDLTGLGRGKDFSVHQLGHTVSAVFDLAHGASLTAMWCHWARYVCQTDPARFARLGRQVLGVTLSEDAAAARETITQFGKLWQSWGLPTSLGQCVGIQTEGTLRRMAHLCSYEGTRTVGTFRPLNETDLLAIYRLANV